MLVLLKVWEKFLLGSNLTQTACHNPYLMLIKSDYFYYYSLYFNLALQ